MNPQYPYNNPYGNYNPNNQYEYEQEPNIDPQTGLPYEYYCEEYYEEATDDLHADDYDQMEEMERAMLGDPAINPTSTGAPSATQSKFTPAPAKTGGAFIPAGAMPSQGGVLSAHAAEFWFPENRNCPCCKGYRHGCECTKSGVNTCTHAKCTDQEHAAQVTRSLSEKATAEPTTVFAAPTAAAASNTVPIPSGPTMTRGNSDSQPCKFYSSGSCRFGDSCRFAHPSKGAAGISPAVPARSNACLYFAQGKCTQGANCKFSHNQ